MNSITPDIISCTILNADFKAPTKIKDTDFYNLSCSIEYIPERGYVAKFGVRLTAPPAVILEIIPTETLISTGLMPITRCMIWHDSKDEVQIPLCAIPGAKINANLKANLFRLVPYLVTASELTIVQGQGQVQGQVQRNPVPPQSGQGYPGNTQVQGSQCYPNNTQVQGGQGYPGNTQVQRSFDDHDYEETQANGYFANNTANQNRPGEYNRNSGNNTVSPNNYGYPASQPPVQNQSQNYPGPNRQNGQGYQGGYPNTDYQNIQRRTSGPRTNGQ